MSGSSPSIEVLKPGLLTTVQDLGRPGYGPMGVSASGAADPISLRVGNLILGNPEGAAALEMTLEGGIFRFPEGAVVALAGSDFGAGLPLWTACQIAAGDTLACVGCRSGARSYLCVRGGLAVEKFLGSASTHILSGLGGRILKPGDVLKIGREIRGPVREINPPALRRLSWRKVLRAVDGPQSEWFAQDFFSGKFSVAEEANRMGLRLNGTRFETSHPGRMLSEGVSLGAIQIAAGGQPIVMFVEQQTSGGYPKIASIVSADMASVGQLRPRDEIRFERVTMERALDLRLHQERLIRSGELFA